MRYIDADLLEPDTEWDDYKDGYMSYSDLQIRCAKTADVRENIKGKWQITDAYPHNVYCSVCHTKFAQTHWAVWKDRSLPRNYCPNCGADMKGK